MTMSRVGMWLRRYRRLLPFPLAGIVFTLLPPGSSGASTRVVAEVRSKLKPDWIAREPVRARLRSAIKRLLARRNYLPDEAPESIDLVLKQMEQFANEWSTNGTQDS